MPPRSISLNIESRKRSNGSPARCGTNGSRPGAEAERSQSRPNGEFRMARTRVLGIINFRRPMNPEDIAASIEMHLRSQIGGSPAGPESPRPRLQVPDHELIRRIGGGGYGEVWIARSVTGQLRAVKIVWRQNFSSDRPYEREFRGIVQFEPISRSHPGVINILHVGRDDSAGCFFYVMELADPVELPTG